MNDDRLTFRDVLHALAPIAGSIAFCGMVVPTSIWLGPLGTVF